MKNKLERDFEKIIEDIFGNKLSVTEAVSITYVLNLYDIYVSGKFPSSIEKKDKLVQLTLESISYILSGFKIGEEFYKPVEWRGHKYVAEHENLYKKPEFKTLNDNIANKFEEHPWISKLE